MTPNYYAALIFLLLLLLLLFLVLVLVMVLVLVLILVLVLVLDLVLLVLVLVLTLVLVSVLLLLLPLPFVWHYAVSSSIRKDGWTQELSMVMNTAHKKPGGSHQEASQPFSPPFYTDNSPSSCARLS